jgi:hypothetical protein
MPKVEEHVGILGLDSLTVDIDITAESPDGEEALEWVEDIRDAVKETTREKKEREDENS